MIDRNGCLPLLYASVVFMLVIPAILMFTLSSEIALLIGCVASLLIGALMAYYYLENDF